MANADMCLEAARKAFPYNEELRAAYMVGFNEGFDRAMEQPEVEEEKEVEEWWQNWASPPRNEYAVFNKEEFINLARHFYELGLNARKEE